MWRGGGESIIIYQFLYCVTALHRKYQSTPFSYLRDFHCICDEHRCTLYYNDRYLARICSLYWNEATLKRFVIVYLVLVADFEMYCKFVERYFRMTCDHHPKFFSDLESSSHWKILNSRIVASVQHCTQIKINYINLDFLCYNFHVELIQNCVLLYTNTTYKREAKNRTLSNNNKNMSEENYFSIKQQKHSRTIHQLLTFLPLEWIGFLSVSYTHLTLPTIYSV